MSFQSILEKYRQRAHSERDKGDRFERLMQGFLLTDPTYTPVLKEVWLWGGVEKMRFPKKDPRLAGHSKDTILYNGHIRIEGIPAKAYAYVVNGKSAIEWIMERYAITTHKESGIRNDPNDWAREHKKPRYVLDLLLSVIEVSVRSVGVVEGLG